MSQRFGHIEAKPTEWRGILFRSRLEARWAVFFDAAGIPYEYEPETFVLPSGLCLPDFWMPDQKCFIEIKPVNPEEDFWQIHAELATKTQKKVYTFNEGIFLPRDFCCPSSHVLFPDSLSAGWFDMGHAWCECSYCHRKGIEFGGRSERLHYRDRFPARKDECAKPDRHDRDTGGDTPLLLASYRAALSERFGVYPEATRTAWRGR